MIDNGLLLVFKDICESNSKAAAIQQAKRKGEIMYYIGKFYGFLLFEKDDGTVYISQA